MRAFEFLKESNVIKGNFGDPLHNITMGQADKVIKKVGLDLNFIFNKPFDSKIYETLIDAYMNQIKGTKDDKVMKGIIHLYQQRGIRAKELPPINEAPILRPAGSYDPDPNDVYHTATNNTAPKYNYDPEVDYSPGTYLGPIPNIQSNTQVVQMPNGDLFLFYAKVLPPKPITYKNLRQQIKGFLLKNQTGPAKGTNILGFLKLKPYKDGYRVAGVGMDQSIQGQGRAIKLYLAFTAWKDVPIYSDFTQTPSAKRMWKSILGRYPNRVVAYDQKSKKETPIDDMDAMYQDEPEGYTNFTPHEAQKTLKNTTLFKLLP